MLEGNDKVAGKVERLPENHEYLKPGWTSVGNVVWAGGARITEPHEGQKVKRYILRVGRAETGRTYHVVCREVEGIGLLPPDGEVNLHEIRLRYWEKLAMALGDTFGL